MGVVTKSTLLGALMLLVSGAASAQDLMISPDGNYVARHVIETEPDFERGILPRHRLEIVSVECLKHKQTLDSCVVLSPPNVFRKGNRPRWSIDSTGFVTGTQQLLFSLDGSIKPLTGYPWAVEPRVIDLGGPDGKGVPPTPQRGDDYLIVNGQGTVVARQRWGYDAITIESVAGHSLEVTMQAVVAGDVGSARQWIYPSTNGDTFWYWSPMLGERGRLVAFDAEGLEDVPLPRAAKGPLNIVADEGSNQPVAIFDAFGVHPLPGREQALDWLVSELDAVRSATRPMIKSVTVAVAAKVAFVRFQPGLSPCFEDWLLTEEASNRISEPCDPREGDATYAVSYVEVPGPISLPARLYRSRASEQASRNLIIFMHGGPRANSFNAIMMDGLYADERFDVLAVDFRGSSGMGLSHALALHPPVGDISAEDLRLAVDWARDQPNYRDGLVGVWGSSWGGLSVHAITSRDSNGIDFLISNSGYIENPPEIVGSLCELSGWVPHVYGAYVDAKGDCLAAFSGVLGREVISRVPVLTLSGAHEQPGTPFKTQILWAKQARREGACISTVYSESGGHVGQRWPESARTIAQETIRDWIDSVAKRDRAACGVDVRVP